ncbi:MAG: YggS family pyridoxal phosphate-dependent enzyme [Planctomycetales bacterium]|nr:YggS family pyridoxal phosphate-dependent enzyme [Planctomycetales bacterium]
MSAAIVEQFRENLANVESRIAEASRAAGRPTNDVRLIAVSKYAPAPIVQCLVDAGATDLGESRPQALWDKAEVIRDASGQSPRWHLIGHLQRNKVKRTLPLVHAIHSLDSRRLLDEIEKEAAETQRTVRGFLEVNVSQDSSKTGLSPSAAIELLASRETWPHMEWVGLMGMASLDGNTAEARREFSLIRELRDDLSHRSGLPLPALSMGMSGDFEAAIAEGATHVRIGSSLFAGIDTRLP